MEEIWKDIKDFEGLYQVSNYGNVKSIDRKIIEKNNDIQFWKGKKLKPFNNGNNYLTVHLKKDGKRYVKYIHRLVAETFIGNIKNKDVNHKDFNRKNNNINNLEICSRKENILYSKNNGKYEKVYIQKVQKTKERYNELKEDIIKDMENGLSIRKIEKKYNVNHKTLKKYGYYC